MKNKLNNLFDKNKIKEAISNVAEEVGKLSDEAKNALTNEKINEITTEMNKYISKAGVVAKDAIKDVSNKTGVVSSELVEKTKQTYDVAQKKVIETLDQNGDGKVEIEDIIILGLKTPGVRVDRDNFLRTELNKYCTKDVIEDAVLYNPAHAKIDKKLIDKIADDVIQYERVCVSGISAVLGSTGAVSSVVTVPTDIAQYYGYMLRAIQKLLYLYGFPKIDVEEKGQMFDHETINTMILCLGVMYGVSGARGALVSMATALGKGVKKKLMAASLTKGTLYPIIKAIASWFNVKLTKEVFSSFFEKSLPVVGGVIGGGLTYLSFKPCCDKLKDVLEDTILSNPDSEINEQIVDIIDIEAEIIESAE